MVAFTGQFRHDICTGDILHNLVKGGIHSLVKGGIL